ncbi:MAG: hypothetical protein HY302_14065 [Opitutae bacterium]|nr:hypothetical protein [Opitutae bacterium]
MALILAGSGRAADDPPPAPLANVKEELRALQKDQAAAKTGEAETSLKDGLPQFQSPIPGALPFELPRAKTPESESKKKRDAQKNWLLDGVGKLDDEAKLKAKGLSKSERDAAEADGEKPDPSDPDYFLQVYREQQKKENAAKAADADQKKDAAAPADPLAPFLQGWLAGSPVRGKFFDEFLRRPSSAGDGPNAADRAALPAEVSPDSGLSVTDPSGGRAPAPGKNAPPAPNPYLQAFDLGELKSAAPAPPAPAAGGYDPAARLFDRKPPAPPGPAESPPPARTGDRKPPRSPFEDGRFFPKKNF